MTKTTSRLFFFFLSMTFWFSVRSQTQVDILPHWKKEETHSVKIKTTTTDIKNDKTQKYVSTFDANFKVLEVTDSSYKVEWVYTSSKLADNEPVIESQIVANLINVKLIIMLSDVGRFMKLINSNEVKIAADKAIDDLITNSTSNPTMNIQFRSAKQVIASKQGLEIALLKQIKFYNFSFGFTYTLDQVQTNNISLTNPLGGPSFDGIEKVQLTKIDRSNSTCVIETSKKVETAVLKSAIVEYLKKASKTDSKKKVDEIEKANIELSENTMQQIDFSKGILQRSFFNRTMNFGFQSRTSILEIETVN